ncbi:Flp pilus assembly complex ATPase component TadA [Candidatus Sulfurimonas marisnigri]|uniref:Flp pilus assembly complex ATPase component TadA n=1 Tax=Candidatus Sulfurimonas marisnigri TaxID=2740405 RepID=A0A7S7RQG1_9BACT|nr:ATPase, T2SS/T4P/T4SS family [Candidatus Sulfurimonas marisnigri]QOY55392.1 Flp pilus assembly complex ATPase component TadA [Candidatus Sulfurimonas marisnigri]
MNINKILTPKQIEICKEEKSYYQRIGIKKNILQIAIEHNFIKKKEKKAQYSLELLKKYEIIIINEDEKNFYIECKELLGPNRLKELESQLHKKIIQHSIPVREFNEKFDVILSIDPDIIEKKIRQFNAFDSDDTEILELLRMILKHGVRNNISDIHINAYEEFSWLRYRENGKINAKYLLNKDLADRFSLILKEKARIDLIDVKSPKSGGFTENIGIDNVDFRIEIAPSHFGENIVIRILDKSNNLKSLEQLFPKDHPMSEHIFRYINQKNGFFLAVGPTGSGKTTTLNAILTQRDRLHEVIYTIEDPIEYKIDFITQYQVNEAVGFNFDTAMKSIMRQDPDVIVIGEMRDKLSIEIALKASHSGHMVYSTLHTTNSYMALERIRDEGGDLFILAYSLSGVIAQRLVSKLCSCKIKSTDEIGKKYFKSNDFGYNKRGCIKCNFSGYNSRVLLTDIVFIPPDMKTRYTFYMALKNSTVLQAWDQLITFSYYQSAQYLFEQGLCDYESLSSELFSLGYVDED